jgi:hypothetical protein
LLKAPGTERWNLKHDELLSRFYFNFNLRRYNVAALRRLVKNHIDINQAAGAYTRPLFSST